MSKYRYPGPQPFTKDEKDVFFGREEETAALINLIVANKLNILFGRSGNGKSSLIHAALIPHFETEQYKIVELRVQPFKSSTIVNAAFDAPGEKQHSLKGQIIAELKKNLDSEKIYFSEILPEGPETPLWQYFKTLQWDIKKKGYEGIIVIIDQFEELFNFPVEEYKQFAHEFSEIIYNRTPFEFQKALTNKIKEDEKFPTENSFKLDFIKNDFFCNFLIGIRSDRLYLLDELGDVIPMIFNKRFRLNHLSAQKVDEAIEKPASLKGSFESPIFKIDPTVINEIKQYLFDGSSASQAGYIETFQLQIICQFIEKKVIGFPKSNEEKVTVTKAILEKEVSEIIKEYYEEIIKDINSDNTEYSRIQTLFIRYLVEKKLIDVKTNNRICLDKTSIYPLGIDDSTLNHLIISKIIRKEINTVSGESFEISHDSLVRPILKASNSISLGELETQLYNFYLENIKLFDRKTKRVYKRILLPKLLNKENNLEALKLVEQLDKQNLPDDSFVRLQSSGIETSVALLEKRNILEKIEDKKNKDSFYIVNEVFRDAIIKKQNEEGLKRQNFVRLSILALFMFLAFFVFMAIKNAEQHKIDNAKINLFSHISIFNPPTSNKADTITSVKKLLLLSETYKTIRHADPSTELIARNVFTTFFNSYDFLGKRISAPGLFPYAIKKSDTSLLVYYKATKDTNQNTFPATVYLYNHKGKYVNKYSRVLDASFTGHSDLVVLRSDTLIIHSNKTDKKVKIQFGNIASLKNSIVKIDSVKNKDVYIQISPISQKEAYGTYQGPIFAKLNYDGHIEKIEPIFQYMTYEAYTTNPKETIRKFKNMTLTYPYLGNSMSLKSGLKKPNTSVNLDYPILDASFSSTGDTIFVNDGQYLTIVDKTLAILSKYKNSSTSNGQAKSSLNYIAYLQPGYVVLIDLQNPIIKSVNTLQPESIIKYIDSKSHMVYWPELTDADRKSFGFN